MDLRVLFIEDSENDVLLLLRELQKGGYDVQWERVDTIADVQLALSHQAWDLILCDYSMPGMNAQQVLEVLQKIDLDLPLIIVSGTVEEDTAISALKAGAHDFLTKNKLARFLPAVQRELKEAEIRREHKQADHDLQSSELRFRSILENMLEGCQIIGFDWRYLYLNDSAVNQSQQTREELLGRTMMECYPGIEDSALFEALKACMSERTSHHMVNEFSYPDVTKGWFELSIQPSPDGVLILSGDITNRKKTEQAILEREMKLSMLLDILPVGISILDAESNVSYINPALKKIIDISEEELRKGTYRDRKYLRADGSLMPADEMASVQAIKYNKVVEAIETGVTKEDNSIVWTNVSAVPVDFSDWKTVIVTADITGRKLAEEAKSYLAAIVEHSNDAIISKDLTGIITSWNMGAQKMFGYTAGEMIGQPIIRLIPADHIMEEEQILNQVKQGNSVRDFETTRITKDGKQINVSIVVSPVKDITGKIIGASKVARDITERKQAQEKLKESEEKFSIAFQSSPLALFITTFQGEFIEVNNAFCELVGYSTEEIIGNTLVALGFLGLQDREKLLTLFQSKRGSINNFETQIRVKNGSLRDILYSLETISFRGELQRLSTGVDITERKQAEREILKLNAELETKVAERTLELAVANEQLRQLSLFDELTGLYNRRGFLLHAQEQLLLAKRTQRNMLAFYADLDLLKHINDHSGHMAGDEALIAASRALKETFRASDIKARLGGDEFIVLAWEAGEQDAQVLLARLRERLAANHQSMSIGVVVCDAQRELFIDEIIAAADQAMYVEKRKKAGRGTA